MIWNWFKQLYTKVVEDDPKKIKDILNVLNKEEGSNWEDVEGYHALISVSHDSNGLGFNIGSGIILKAFINHTTGEIRTFYFKKAVKD